MSQTAVEWLCSQIYTIQVELEAGNNHLKNKIDKAKAMEKQQIIDFTDNYILECLTCSYNGEPTSLKETEQYYNEQFKQD
jgi:hypothetical protein